MGTVNYQITVPIQVDQDTRGLKDQWKEDK